MSKKNTSPGASGRPCRSSTRDCRSRSQKRFNSTHSRVFSPHRMFNQTADDTRDAGYRSTFLCSSCKKKFKIKRLASGQEGIHSAQNKRCRPSSAGVCCEYPSGPPMNCIPAKYTNSKNHCTCVSKQISEDCNQKLQKQREVSGKNRCTSGADASTLSTNVKTQNAKPSPSKQTSKNTRNSYQAKRTSINEKRLSNRYSLEEGISNKVKTAETSNTDNLNDGNSRKSGDIGTNKKNIAKLPPKQKYIEKGAQDKKRLSNGSQKSGYSSSKNIVVSPVKAHVPNDQQLVKKNFPGKRNSTDASRRRTSSASKASNVEYLENKRENVEQIFNSSENQPNLQATFRHSISLATQTYDREFHINENEAARKKLTSSNGQQLTCGSDNDQWHSLNPSSELLIDGNGTCSDDECACGFFPSDSQDDIDARTPDLSNISSFATPKISDARYCIDKNDAMKQNLTKPEGLFSNGRKYEAEDITKKANYTDEAKRYSNVASQTSTIIALIDHGRACDVFTSINKVNIPKPIPEKRNSAGASSKHSSEISISAVVDDNKAVEQNLSDTEAHSSNDQQHIDELTSEKLNSTDNNEECVQNLNHPEVPTIDNQECTCDLSLSDMPNSADESTRRTSAISETSNVRNSFDKKDTIVQSLTNPEAPFSKSQQIIAVGIAEIRNSIDASIKRNSAASRTYDVTRSIDENEVISNEQQQQLIEEIPAQQLSSTNISSRRISNTSKSSNARRSIDNNEDVDLSKTNPEVPTADDGDCTCDLLPISDQECTCDLLPISDQECTCDDIPLSKKPCISENTASSRRSSAASKNSNVRRSINNIETLKDSLNNSEASLTKDKPNIVQSTTVNCNSLETSSNRSLPASNIYNAEYSNDAVGQSSTNPEEFPFNCQQFNGIGTDAIIEGSVDKIEAGRESLRSPEFPIGSDEPTMDNLEGKRNSTDASGKRISSASKTFSTRRSVDANEVVVHETNLEQELSKQVPCSYCLHKYGLNKNCTISKTSLNQNSSHHEDLEENDSSKSRQCKGCDMRPCSKFAKSRIIDRVETDANNSSTNLSKNGPCSNDLKDSYFVKSYRDLESPASASVYCSAIDCTKAMERSFDINSTTARRYRCGHKENSKLNSSGGQYMNSENQLSCSRRAVPGGVCCIKPNQYSSDKKLSNCMLCPHYAQNSNLKSKSPKANQMNKNDTSSQQDTINTESPTKSGCENANCTCYESKSINKKCSGKIQSNKSQNLNANTRENQSTKKEYCKPQPNKLKNVQVNATTDKYNYDCPNVEENNIQALTSISQYSEAYKCGIDNVETHNFTAVCHSNPSSGIAEVLIRFSLGEQCTDSKNQSSNEDSKGVVHDVSIDIKSLQCNREHLWDDTVACYGFDDNKTTSALTLCSHCKRNSESYQICDPSAIKHPCDTSRIVSGSDRNDNADGQSGVLESKSFYFDALSIRSKDSKCDFADVTSVTSIFPHNEGR